MHFFFDSDGFVCVIKFNKLGKSKNTMLLYFKLKELFLYVTKKKVYEWTFRINRSSLKY